MGRGNRIDWMSGDAELMFPQNLVAVVACLAFFVVPALPAAASPITPGVTYQILDHPDGGLAPPLYSLRLDGLGGDACDDYTFSSQTDGALLTLLYDQLAGSLTISGTVYGGKVVDHAYVAPQLWSLSFTYTSLFDLGNALEADPGSGSGTITALGNMNMGVGGFGVGQMIGLVDKANMAGLAFRLDFGHRAPIDVTTGHGWLTHDALTPRTDYQDWLFTLGAPVVVPEPGTALLIGLGLAVLAGVTRERSVN